MNKTESENFTPAFQQIFADLSSKNDEKCVLVVGRLVEDFLREGIEARLQPERNKQDNVSRNLKGSFAFKIDLAYRIGLIPSKEANVYHQLREIRNKCAHEVADQDFEKEHFKARMINIIKDSDELWNAIKKAKLAQQPDENTNSVEDFVEGLGWRVAFDLLFSLVLAHKQVSRDRVYQVSRLYDPPLARLKQHMGIVEAPEPATPTS